MPGTFLDSGGGYQEISQMIHLGGGKTYFVRKDGVDTANGLRPTQAFLTLTKALSVYQAGDEIKLGNGVFDEGTNKLTLKARTLLSGAGRFRSQILSQVNQTAGVIMPFADGSEVEDLSLVGNSSTVTQCPLGAKHLVDAGWLNATMRRCYVYGNIDVVQVFRESGSYTCTGKFYDCILEGGFDLVVFSATGAVNSLMEFWNCVGNSDTSLILGATSAGNITRNLVSLNTGAASNIIRWTGGRLRSVGGGDVAHCVHGTNDTIELYGVDRMESSSGGEAMDLYQSGSGVVRPTKCVYDTGKTTGVITVGTQV